MSDENVNKKEKKVPVVGEAYGKPVITLNPGEFRPFSFGLGKARLMLEHIDVIRAFVESEGKSC